MHMRIGVPPLPRLSPLSTYPPTHPPLSQQQCPVVERLANSLMRKGRNSGKKLMANRIVKHTLEIIHLLTDQNPVQVVVDSIINAGPREDSTRVGSAGVVRRQAVDMSPFRRVNQAIYLITTGARESSFRNIKVGPPPTHPPTFVLDSFEPPRSPPSNPPTLLLYSFRPPRSLPSNQPTHPPTHPPTYTDDCRDAGRRDHQRGKGLLQQLCDQEEGRGGACRQGQPINHHPPSYLFGWVCF